jgi:hypothetical protein
MLEVIAFVALMGVAGMAFLTGAVVFIAGLVKKRTRMWKTGLVLALASLLALSGGAGWGLYRAASKVAQVWQALTGPPTESEMRELFRDATDLELPADARCLDGRVDISYAFGTGFMAVVFLKLEVPEAFKQTLRTRFELKGSADEHMALGEEQRGATPWWDPGELKGMTCYQGNSKPGPDGYYFDTMVAFDEARPVVYLFAGEVCPTDDWGGPSGAATEPAQSGQNGLAEPRDAN